MEKYRKKLELMLKDTNTSVKKSSIKDLFANKKIIVYGAGGLGDTFITRMRKYNLNVIAVIDKKYSSNSKFYNIPAFHPSEFKTENVDKENCVVVVAVSEREYHDEIFKYFKKIKLSNIILYTDIYEMQLFEEPAELQKDRVKYFKDNSNNILETLRLFSDELSYEVYTKFLETHITQKFVLLPGHPREQQYFPKDKDIKLTKGMSRFINCGAYRGDTIKKLNSLYGKVDAIACFEPDVDTFQILVDYVKENNCNLANEIFLYPCGVYKNNLQVYFSKANISSKISDKGDSLIQCVTLDSVIPAFKPTYINMDIEGAELDALMGAKQLIKKNRPDLAICVYHSPSHVWEIPNFINKLDLGYRFYLRTYTYFTNETVLYAVSAD